MDLKMSTYTRKELDAQLLEILNGEHYKAEADKPNIKSFIIISWKIGKLFIVFIRMEYLYY
jgi:hypothetical protein